MKELVYYQNIANFVISIIVCFNLYYYYHVDKNTLNYSIPIIFTHFCIDLFVCKTDMKIHHFLGIVLISFKYIYNIQSDIDSTNILALYKTEISTVFYIIKLWNNDNYLQNTYKLPKLIFVVNDLLFFVTFFKFRLFDYYLYSINDRTNYSDYQIYFNYEIIPNLLFFSTAFGYFFLNLYWFLIICKIITKSLIKKLDKKILQNICHRIVSYSFYFNILISSYVYSFDPKQSNIFDVAGITFLSYYSYKYHDAVIDYLSNNQMIEYSSYELVLPFIQDKFAIHIRSFGCLLTSSFYNQHLFSMVLMSSIFHCSSFVSLLFYFYYIKRNNYKIVYNDSKTTEYFLTTTNILSIIPIIIDSTIIAYNSHDLIEQINVLFILIAIGMIMKINPFYDLNHIFVHIGLCVQTYIMSNCNIS